MRTPYQIWLDAAQDPVRFVELIEVHCTAPEVPPTEPVVDCKGCGESFVWWLHPVQLCDACAERQIGQAREQDASTCGAQLECGSQAGHVPGLPGSSPTHMHWSSWFVSVIDLLIKKPSIIELIGRCALTRNEYRKVYADHDDGDEDVRRYGRWVCGLGKRPCAQDPNHWGPHDWQASSTYLST